MKWNGIWNISTLSAEGAWTSAGPYANLYSFILWASLTVSLILLGGMAFFLIKYRRKSKAQVSLFSRLDTTVESLWSFLPLFIFVGLIGWGWSVYNRNRVFPDDALEVQVFGRQWSWDFKYPSGKNSLNEFFVPVNANIKLILTSDDVVHSFYIPSLRIKQDAVPGRYSALGFNSGKAGDYQIFCAQSCGGAHAKMWGKLHVVSQEKYDQWLKSQ